MKDRRQEQRIPGELRRFYAGAAPGWLAVSRGAAFGLCLLLAACLAEILTFGTSSVDNWMTSLRPAPQPVATAVLAATLTSFFLFTFRPALPLPVWIVAIAGVAAFTAACGRELSLVSGSAVGNERLAAMVRPLGILMLFSVAGIGVLFGRSPMAQGRSSGFTIIGSTLLTIAAFVTVTVQGGMTADPVSESPASLILVSACVPGDDGLLSDEMSDRLRTACDQWKERNGRLVIAGTAAEIGDAEIIRARTTELGVPAEQTVIQLTANGPPDALAQLSDPENPAMSVIVVSHWYELARLRLLGRRAGLQVQGIPARQQHAVFRQNLLVAVEAWKLLKEFAAPVQHLVQAPARFDPAGAPSESQEAPEGDADADIDDLPDPGTEQDAADDPGADRNR